MNIRYPIYEGVYRILTIMETANIQSVVENNIVSVALMNIQPSSYNPRKHFDEVSLAELAESIRQQGVLQPIGVRPIADTDRFEIVFGERRYRAALMAELTEISAVILHVSDETAAEMAVTENLQRKDVTPIEEANAYPGASGAADDPVGDRGYTALVRNFGNQGLDRESEQ